MKRILLLLLPAAALLLVLQQAVAQQAKPKPGEKPVEKKIVVAKLPEVPTSLGASGLNGGKITKQQFDDAVKQGVHLHGAGTIKGFNFTYAERTLYEDSAGNPMVVVDYLQEHCEGDTLSPGIKYSLFDRTKPGDTAYFSQIKIILPSGAEAHGTPMKFLIVPSGGRR